MLRNSKEPERNHASLWTVRPATDEKTQQINLLVEEFEKELPTNLTSAQRNQAIDQRREFVTANWNLIQQCQNEDFRNHLFKQFEVGYAEILESDGKSCEAMMKIYSQFKLPKKEYEPPSVIAEFAKTIAWGALSSYAPTITFLLSLGLAIAPAAAQSSVAVYGGVPTDGKNICSGISNCGQGYAIVANGTESILHQFNKVIQQVGGSLNLGALWAMKDCLTTGLVGDIVKSTLESTPGSSTEILPTCNAQSSTLFGYRGSSTLTNVAKDTCDAFQNNFPTLTNKCIDTGKAIGLNVAISVMIMGGLAALACIAACSICLVKNVECRRPRNCC